MCLYIFHLIFFSFYSYFPQLLHNFHNILFNGALHSTEWIFHSLLYQPLFLDSLVFPFFITIIFVYNLYKMHLGNITISGISYVRGHERF